MVIAGVVVLYNPDQTVVANIKSYLDFLQTLYVIDNTEKLNLEIVEQLKKLARRIQYLALGANNGVAHA